MKPNTKSLILNILVCAVLLLSSGIFFRLFWSELFKDVDNVEGIVIGELVTISGQAHRRNVTQDRWGSIKNNESIYNLDAIRTSEGANASIILRTDKPDGKIAYDELTLGPNTFIILDISDRNRNVSFVAGDIFAKGSDLSIVSEGTVISPDGTVRVTREEGKSTSIAALEGEATISVNGNEKVINNETEIQINDDSSEIIEHRNPVVLLFPEANALLLTFTNNRIVDFSWKFIENWTNTRLEISPDPAFVAGPETRMINAKTSASVELETGTWFWRILNIDTGIASNSYSLVVGTEQQVNLYSPANNLTIPYRGNAPSINFQWSPPQFADVQILEISQTADFDNPLIRKETDSNSLLISELPEGEWWWRIIPVYRRDFLADKIVPKQNRFTLERRVQYEAVKLLFPADKSSINTLEALNGIDFRWQKQNGLTSYTISVARDSRFQEVVVEETLADTWKKLIENPDGGTYYWKVEAVSSDDIPVPPSMTRSFNIIVNIRSVELVMPPIGDVQLEPYEPYTFIWKSIASGVSRFQLQRIEGFARTAIIDNLLQGDRFTMPMPGEGSYEWQVEILDSSNRTLAQSQKGRFGILSHFTAPPLISPLPGESVDLPGSRNIEITWASVPEANAYKVLLRSPDGAILGSDQITKLSKTFTLPGNTGQGFYEIELTSVKLSANNVAPKTSQTATYNFRVGKIIAYNAAVPESPRANAVLESRATAINGVQLRWNQQPQLARWIVELISNNGRGRSTMLYESPTTTLNIQGLAPGIYTWTIRSFDTDDNEAPVSQPQQFRINDYPLPVAPDITYPRVNQIIDMTGQNQLQFRWQSAISQYQYDLTIRSADRVVFEKKGLTTTSYTMRDQELRYLNVGNFIFELVGIIEVPETGTMRKSQKTSVPFSLIVNISNKAPKILTDELQYAE